MGIMDKWKKKDKVLKQDLSQKAESERRLFLIWFLFEGEPEMPETAATKAALERTFGEVDVVTDAALRSFAVKKYVSHFEEGDLPAQVLISDPQLYNPELISDFERTQLWDVKDSDGLLHGLTHQLFVSDMMALLPYRERSEMLMDWMEAALALLPGCKAVWIPSAGKLFTADQVRNHSLPREDRFVYFGVNARFFNIQGGDAMLIDTLGMYAMGLPDIQYHFCGLKPDSVVNHAYNTASYLFQNDVPIESGETIDGLADGQMSRDVQWRCQYEHSLVQPVRDVMDICPGEYAAGRRGEAQD